MRSISWFRNFSISSDGAHTLTATLSPDLFLRFLMDDGGHSSGIIVYSPILLCNVSLEVILLRMHPLGKKYGCLSLLNEDHASLVIKFANVILALPSCCHDTWKPKRGVKIITLLILIEASHYGFLIENFCRAGVSYRAFQLLDKLNEQSGSFQYYDHMSDISMRALFVACFWEETRPPDFFYEHDHHCLLIQCAISTHGEFFCYWISVVSVHEFNIDKGYFTGVLVYSAFEPWWFSSTPLYSSKKLGAPVVSLIYQHMVFPIMAYTNFFARWKVILIVELFVFNNMEDNFDQCATTVVLITWSNSLIVASVHYHDLPCYHFNGLHISNGQYQQAVYTGMINHELLISKTEFMLITRGFCYTDFPMCMIELISEHLYAPIEQKVSQVIFIFVALFSYPGSDKSHLSLVLDMLICTTGIFTLAFLVIRAGQVNFEVNESVSYAGTELKYQTPVGGYCSSAEGDPGLTFNYAASQITWG